MAHFWHIISGKINLMTLKEFHFLFALNPLIYKAIFQQIFFPPLLAQFFGNSFFTIFKCAVSWDPEIVQLL